MQKVTQRRHMKWLAVLQLILLLFTISPTTLAAQNPVTPDEIQVLTHYQIVRGDQFGNLNLDKPITRAEMITIMVRAIGAEEQASLFKGLSPFSDTGGHWAEGYISYAAVYKLVKGDGDGKARPDDQITYGEALTLLLRILGKEPRAGTWPVNVILEANTLGLLPTGVTVSTVNSAAVRGEVFRSMARGLIAVKDANGKTVLQAKLDSVAPTITMNPVAEESNGLFRISGKVSEKSIVTVNGMPITLSPSLAFSTAMELDYGTYQVEVVATDLAGNGKSISVEVSRNLPIASLEFSGPSKVRPDGTGEFIITAKNEAGEVIPNSTLKATVDGNIGSFDLSTGLFQASQVSGKGRITVSAGNMSKSIIVEVMGPDTSATAVRIRPVNDGRSVPYTRSMVVQVEVVDGNGQLVDTDYNRPVTLVAGGPVGVKVSQHTLKTEDGLVTFTVSASEMGAVTLTASSQGLTSSTREAYFGSNLRVVLVADPTTLVVGSDNTSARIKAELHDASDNLVPNNTGSDIHVKLAIAGPDSYVSDGSITIMRGLSTSSAGGNDGWVSARTEAGTILVTGSLLSEHELTVDPVPVSVTVPVVGPGTKFVVDPPGTKDVGEEGTYLIHVVDANGNVIPTGSYAFQVEVETSNGEAKTDGVPADMSIRLGSTNYNPVSDGIGENRDDDGEDIVARTVGGSASVRVTYNKPGRVTLKVIPYGSHEDTYSSDGLLNEASSSTSFGSEPGTGLVTTDAAGLKMTADSSLGKDQAAASVSSGGTVTLNAYVTDALGRWIPGKSVEITLSKVGSSTQLPSKTTVTTLDGKATFTVRATNSKGDDTYKITATINDETIESNDMVVRVEEAVPETPVVAAARGIKDNAPKTLNFVGPDDDGLEIELLPFTGDSYWVQLKVVREGSNTAIYTSPAVDMSASAPKIVVPKASLNSGIQSYQVIAVNAKGSSPRSNSTGPVTNAQVTTGISISRARYDYVTKTLVIQGSGFNAADTVDPSLIRVRDISISEDLTLSGAIVTITKSSEMILEVDQLLAEKLEDPTRFSGTDLRVEAALGWYTRSNGQVAAADTSGNTLTPGASIDYAVYNQSNRRLYVYGEGFTTGTIDFSKLQLTSDGGGTTYTLSSYSPSRSSDKLLTFNLNSSNSALAAVIDDLADYADYVVDAGDGWFYDGPAKRAPVEGVQIYAQVSLSSVTYDATANKIVISGSGFLGGDVILANLSVVDLSSKSELELVTASVTSQTDTKIEIKLADETKFENASFKGSDIYLQGEAGWFVNVDGRESAPIGSRSLRFPSR